MFWVALITGVIFLGLGIFYGNWATSKDPTERKKFKIIFVVGLLVIAAERLIYHLFD